MFIDDEQALREWLVATLEPLYVEISLIMGFDLCSPRLTRCDAEPIALARYVLALVAKDKPLDRLRENCTDRLEVFFGSGKARTRLSRIRHNDHSRLDTKDFVDKLFDVIRSRRYIPEGKKVRASRERESYAAVARQENVQPTTSDLELEPTDALEAPIASTVTRRDEGPSTESTAIPTVTSAVTVIQPVKR